MQWLWLWRAVNENSLLVAHHPKIQQMLRIQNESNKNISYSEKGKIRLDYIYKDDVEGDKAYQNTILFSADNYGSVKAEDDPNSDFASVENDKFPHLVIGFSQAQTTDTPLTVKQIPYQRLAAIKEPHIKDLLPLLYNQADKRFEAFSDWIVNLYNVGNQFLIEYPKQKIAREHQLIHIIFELISEIIESDIKFKGIKLLNGKDTQNTVWIQDVARNQNIPLHLISQGFNSVFGWVGYLMMRMYETEDHVKTYQRSIHNLFFPEQFEQEADADLITQLTSFYFHKNHALVFIDEIDNLSTPKMAAQNFESTGRKIPKNAVCGYHTFAISCYTFR